MDIESKLREFKQTADETIVREINASSTRELESKIREKLGTSGKRRASWATGVAAAVMVLVCFLAWQQLPPKYFFIHGGTPAIPPAQPSANLNPQANTGPEITPSQEHSPSDEEIEEKVSLLKRQMKLGLTQEQVKKLVGSDYVVVDDNGDLEDGADEYWNYSFFKQPGYVPANPAYVVDQEGLRKRMVGANLFLAWKEKKLYLFTISYVNGDKDEVIFYINNPDGMIKQENMTRPNPRDEFEKGPFTLALDEGLKQRYTLFAKEKKEDALEGLGPIDILKLYYHAKELNDYETVYAFYSHDPGVEMPSLQQFLEEVKKDSVRAKNSREFIKQLKEHAKTYEVIKKEEQEAIIWIRYDNRGKPSGLRLSKNQQGIWKVEWMPLL